MVCSANLLFSTKSSVKFTLITNTLCQKAEFSLGWELKDNDRTLPINCIVN